MKLILAAFNEESTTFDISNNIPSSTSEPLVALTIAEKERKDDRHFVIDDKAEHDCASCC